MVNTQRTASGPLGAGVTWPASLRVFRLREHRLDHRDPRLEGRELLQLVWRRRGLILFLAQGDFLMEEFLVRLLDLLALVSLLTQDFARDIDDPYLEAVLLGGMEKMGRLLLRVIDVITLRAESRP